jgi:hypothetical protein
MKDGSTITLVITRDQPPISLETTIDAPPGSPFGGRWIYRLERSGSGTQLTLTEDGWIDHKFFRIVSRVMGHHGTVDSYLRALNARFGGTDRPSHLVEPSVSPADRVSSTLERRSAIGADAPGFRLRSKVT